MAIKPTSALEIAQALVRIPSVNPNYDPSSVAERNVAWNIAPTHTLAELESGTQTYLRLAPTLMPAATASAEKKVRHR